VGALLRFFYYHFFLTNIYFLTIVIFLSQALVQQNTVK
jgi:hypothetical protein